MVVMGTCGECGHEAFDYACPNCQSNKIEELENTVGNLTNLADGLQAKLEAAKRILQERANLDILDYGWNPKVNRMGYYLRGKWAGTLDEAIAAEAEKGVSDG